MSINLEQKEIEKVNVYLEMISQYNSEIQGLNYTIQKTNQSLKSYGNTVITARNGQLDPDDEYVLNIENYTLELKDKTSASTEAPSGEVDEHGGHLNP